MNVAVVVAEAVAAGEPKHGAEIIVPLNRLKASPRNARKVPHSPATIEAFAASIKAKGVLQPPVVEIERKEDGTATGNYLVTIGEGRRQGLRLLATVVSIDGAVMSLPPLAWVAGPRTARLKPCPSARAG